MHDDDIVLVPLRARDGTVMAHAIVDAADAEFVNQWRWCLNGNGYARRNLKRGKTQQVIYLHRALFGLTKADRVEVDHINRNRLDCRRSNLRIVTRYENMQNFPAQKGRSSRYRGVSYRARLNKWEANVTVNHRHHYIGLFSDEETAAEAARLARARLMPFAPG